MDQISGHVYSNDIPAHAGEVDEPRVPLPSSSVTRTDVRIMLNLTVQVFSQGFSSTLSLWTP